MIVVSITYPGGHEAYFDEGYFIDKHLPLLKGRWSQMGLVGMVLLRGIATPNGGLPPAQVTALLSFRSLSDFGQAARVHGREILDDVANFTNAAPVIQINDAMLH